MVNKSLPKCTDRIYLAGFMGSGKSTVGRLLARKLRREFADLDDVIVRETGMSIPEIFHFKGEGEFRKLESEIAAKFAAGEWVVALGGGTLLNPVTKDLLINSGIVVYMRARASTLAARLRDETRTRPMLSGAGSLEERINELLEARSETYSEAGWIVDTDDLTQEQVAAFLFMKVRAAADE